MTQAVTAKGGMAILALTAHGRDPDPSGQAARAAACGSTTRDTLGCELAAEVLCCFGRLRLRATGASMLPTVWPGDILSVRSHNVVKALPGDIVLFGREGRLVAHRVVERTLCQGRIQWVTRGDSVAGNDAPVSSQELLGRVTAIERGSRRLNPRLTFWRRIGSSILSRSAFCTRLLLRLGHAMPGRHTA